MTTPRIRLDRSPTVVLALCTACPSWREPAATTGDAWALGLDHMTRAHEDPAAVRHADKNARRRVTGGR